MFAEKRRQEEIAAAEERERKETERRIATYRARKAEAYKLPYGQQFIAGPRAEASATCDTRGGVFYTFSRLDKAQEAIRNGYKLPGKVGFQNEGNRLEIDVLEPSGTTRNYYDYDEMSAVDDENIYWECSR